MDINVTLTEAQPINVKANGFQKIDLTQEQIPINVRLSEVNNILISSEIKNIAEVAVKTFSYITNWISLFSKNIEGDLMPVYDFFTNNGLFEVNDNGEIQPTAGIYPDVMFEVIDGNITPRI